MKVLLILVFFLSGVAGLLFETLWFRLSGLAFGNTVLASTLVLSSFMGGLALGNFLAARRGIRIRRPVLAYALLESLVGLLGFALVLVLPQLPAIFAPLYRPFLDVPLVLNPLRFALAFALLVVPTTAMGMTLPLMVKAMVQWRAEFTDALGWLYGVNTLGAMCGALLGEWVLVPALGVTGSGLVAAALDLAAALGAVIVDRGLGAAREEAGGAQPVFPRISPAIARLLAGAFLAGAILLALEVVWFRFLQLFILSTTRGFAIMLLVVLLGIGAGGIASAFWLRARPAAFRWLPHLALAAGLLTLLSYIAFTGAPAGAAGARSVVPGDTLVLSLRLMFPVALVSGLLFPFFGRALFEALPEETGAVGLTTLFNTTGAALGAMTAGWLLIPELGVERALFALALLYCLVAIAALGSLARGARIALAVLAASVVATAAFFPFGLMASHFVPLATKGYRSDDTKIVEVREGLNETIVYLQTYWKGEPYSARLVTNSFSMTGTGLRGERYMKYFAYWPLAFSSRVEKALLVSYGFGVTASALRDAPEIERVDVVDISRDILEMSEHLYPEPDGSPLQDPRFRVFIEDGRFFLLTREEKYDLITGEPPPLMIAGVVNLYTQEYFQLLRNRLQEGGLVTYWLPIVHLSPEDARSVIKGFCNVFEDCSLWRAARFELVLTGSNGAGPVDPHRFDRLWKDPATAKDLARIGLETPELLLATFVGDADFLASFTKDAAPLEDDHPYRLSPAVAPPDLFQARLASYLDLLRDPEMERRYRESAFLKKMLPAELYQKGLLAAPYQSLTELGLSAGPGSLPLNLEPIDRILTETELRTPALWLMGDHHEPSGVIESLAARGALDPEVHYYLGLRGLASRDFDGAERHFREAQAASDGNPELDYYRVLALGYAGRLEDAKKLAASIDRGNDDSRFWDFCRRRFGLELAPGDGE